MSTNPRHPFWTEIFKAVQIEQLQQSAFFGLSCLHLGHRILAALNATGNCLIVKLPPHRVKNLLAEGWGQFFAPDGRIHPEWVEITTFEQGLWIQLIREATRNAEISEAF